MIAVFATADSAHAAGPLGLSDCAPANGVYQCTGLVKTWDGVPLDTTVTLPSAQKRRRPLVANLHGFGNSKHEYLDPASQAYSGNAISWARRGYAVLTYTSRGLWGSCGTPESRVTSPVDCASGYVHLADVRFEGRDTQELIGRLVDQGYVKPRRIGVTGDSYGGGQALMLAALNGRTMLPDGRLVPWRSPSGRHLRLAAAAPVIPWSDLITAAAPNGRVAATRITGRRRATSPVGVEKATFVNAIFAAAQTATGPGQPIGEPFVPGRPMGFLSPPGTDPEADVADWVLTTDMGEPYDGDHPQEVAKLLADYHSAYYIDASRPPPPLFIGSGFTDDLFPADEALRFANRTQRRYPSLPLSLQFGDFGHQRAANKPAERDLLLRNIRGWFSRFLGGRGGPAPKPGVTAFAQTCPREKPSLGPFMARRFSALAKGRHRRRYHRTDVINSASGDAKVGAAIDPVGGMGDGCVATASETAPGTARYRLRAPRKRGLTMVGSPTLRAHLTVQGVPPRDSQLAARIWDVGPDGMQRLVARGSYRPSQGRNRWQLHPAGWRFQRGHAAELEFLGVDAPYSRPSNGQFDVEVSRLRVRLPVRRGQRRP